MRLLKGRNSYEKITNNNKIDQLVAVQNFYNDLPIKSIKGGKKLQFDHLIQKGSEQVSELFGKVYKNL